MWHILKLKHDEVKQKEKSNKALWSVLSLTTGENKPRQERSLDTVSKKAQQPFKGIYLKSSQNHPSSEWLYPLLSNSPSSIPISVKDKFFYCQIQADAAFVITVTFCGALLSTGDSNLSLMPKYCVSSFHLSSFSNCWLLKTNKQTSHYYNHFPFHNL